MIITKKACKDCAHFKKCEFVNDMEALDKVIFDFDVNDAPFRVDVTCADYKVRRWTPYEIKLIRKYVRELTGLKEE